jgi:hypothetical protein
MSQPAEGIGWRTALALAGAYVVVTFITEGRFLADTADYIADALGGHATPYDFGHLLWVPLGRLAGLALGREDFYGSLVLAFLGINWVAGLAAVLLLADTSRRLLPLRGARGVWASAGAGLALLGSHAFLNFLHSGSAYVAGLAVVLLALWHVVRLPAESVWGALGAGAVFGLAICLWFPFVLLTPALLLAPRLLKEEGPHRLRFGLLMGVALGVVVLLAYGGSGWALGVRDIQGLHDWVAESSHGMRSSGLARSALGLARSFISLGDDGLLFKRFLLHDPYNPVSLTDVVRLSLWKVAFFYAALASLVVGLLTSEAGRARLLFLAVAAVPVVGFGIFWQGGDMERYLPLAPFLFLALASAWSAWRWCGWVSLAFFALAGVTNVLALSRWEGDAARVAMKARVEGLAGLSSDSRLFIVRDRLVLLPYNYPFDREAVALPIREAIIFGHADVNKWREKFASDVHKAWGLGGEVWLSKRLLADTPRPDGTWAEGDDPRLTWPEVPAFFQQFETDNDKGGDDGFLRIARSQHNEQLLARYSKRD